MLISLIFCLLVFSGVMVGLGWPLANRLALDPAEKMTAAAALSVLAVFLFAWAVYLSGVPVVWLRIIPFIAALGLVAGYRSLRSTLRNPDAAKLVVGQIIITLLSIGGLAFIVGHAVLGVAVHAGRDAWGLAHIFLQPLILLGLAFLAANWSGLSRPWRLLLISEATLDVVLGIFLQFGAQSYMLERWFTADRPISDLVASYSMQTRMNFGAKVKNHWVFVSDLFSKIGYSCSRRWHFFFSASSGWLRANSRRPHVEGRHE